MPSSHVGSRCSKCKEMQGNARFTPSDGDDGDYHCCGDMEAIIAICWKPWELQIAGNPHHWLPSARVASNRHYAFQDPLHSCGSLVALRLYDCADIPEIGSMPYAWMRLSSRSVFSPGYRSKGPLLTAYAEPTFLPANTLTSVLRSTLLLMEAKPMEAIQTQTLLLR